MKRPIIFFSSFFFILWCQFASAQQYFCGASAAELYTVLPASGLSLRNAPSLSAHKLLAVPQGKTVSVCREGELLQETIEGRSGQWVRAFYRGESGYMFDAYLNPEPEIEVILSDGWAGDYLPQEEQFLGLYMDNENPYESTFRIKAFQQIDDTMTFKGGGEFINASHQLQEHPLFLFSGIDIRSDKHIPGLSFDHKFLFPGESIYLVTEKAAFFLYAKGNVQLNKDGSELSPFSQIKNYELWVRRISGDTAKDKLLYKMDIPAWYGTGDEGGVHLHWLGDLDGDGELDLLLMTNNHHACREVNFFLSSKAEHNEFFRLVSRYQDCGC